MRSMHMRIVRVVTMENELTARGVRSSHAVWSVLVPLRCPFSEACCSPRDRWRRQPWIGVALR